MKRLEALTRTDDVVQGTQARLADPLWLLGRQWQVGELNGEDAATPVSCVGTVEHAPATRLRAGQAVDLAPGGQAPLEALVEREAVLHGEAARKLGGAPLYPAERDAALRRAAMSGRWLLRELGEALQAVAGGAAELPRVLAALAAALAFRGVPPADPGARLLVTRSPSGERGLELAAVADAEALLQRLNLLAPGLAPDVRAVRLALAGAAVAALRRWRDGLAGSVAGQDLGAWDPSVAGHGFTLDVGAGGPALRADDYRGGRLDWYSVRFAEPGGVVEGPKVLSTRPIEGLPRAVRYAGMPASRFWEFEDARVDFGGWRGGVHETVRWLLAEFAVVYGDDWFVAPVDLPWGHLCRVRSLVVRDCFGGEYEVGSFAAADGSRRGWRFFELTGDVGPAAGRSPWLWVAPVLPDRQQGDAVEEVRLLRDEAANLGWAVEQRVEGPDGRARKRAGRAEPPVAAEGAWTYHLAPPFPPGWTPLLLEEVTEAGKARRFLRRGRLPGWSAEDLPRGRLLDATAPLRLVEAIVPRGGLVLTRSPQRARSPDGQVWTWIGREVRPGAGPAEEALTFDGLTRK